MPYDLMPLVHRTVDLYGSSDSGSCPTSNANPDLLFTTAAFQHVIRDEFCLPQFPTAHWVADVLRGLWYVDHATPGVEDDHWRYGMPTTVEKIRLAEMDEELMAVELPESLRDSREVLRRIGL